MRNVLILVLATVAGISAQAAWQEFSIGPSTSNRSQFGPSGVRSEGIPFLRLIARAYGVPEHRIIGPAWLPTERYAITAQVADPKDFQPLMQQELANRFHMLAHREQREVPIFLVKPQEGGAKTSPHNPNAPASIRAGGLELRGATVEAFANTLADSIRRPVFDETGMDGTFDFKLAWKYGDMASLREAVKQQLGLQLVDDRRLVELLIVDQVDKLQFPKQ